MGVGVLGAFFSKSLSGGEEAIACLPPSVATGKSGRNPSSFKICKKENVKNVIVWALTFLFHQIFWGWD